MSDSFTLQGPDEDLDYSHDWSDDMDSQGSPSDTISLSTWNLYGPDVGGSPSPNIHDDSTSGNVTTTFVQDLNIGHVYQLRNSVITSAGRTFTHSWVIRCGRR